MTVLHLTACPMSLRGELTKWLFEVVTGVYVGNLSARVRDRLWEKVKVECKQGRAVMVYTANTEQGFDFRVYGTAYEVIDFDGLKLMLRSSPERLEKVNENEGFI